MENVAEGYLQQNINCIKRYNKTIATTLDIEINHNDFNFGQSLSGDPILYYQGYALNSERDPVKAAENLLNQILAKDNEDAIHILIGIGIGYDFKIFAQNLKGKLILFELRHDILKMMLDLIDFSEEFCMPNILVSTSTAQTVEAVSAFYKENCTLTFSVIDVYKKTAPNLVNEIKTLVEMIIPEKYDGGPLKLNIGPGKWFKKGWKRLDCYTNLTNFDIDLRKMTHLPLEDNVLEKVFSSHCIEHIEDTHLDILIKELYRCMQPGGVLRLSCPDADKALEAYRTGNMEWFNWLSKNSPEKMLINTFVSYEYGQTPQVADELIKEKFETLEKEEFIRWCVAQADRTKPYIAHINGHYFDKLNKKLSEAGFANIKKSTYRGSEDKELRGESFDLYPEISLYIECKKPKKK